MTSQNFNTVKTCIRTCKDMAAIMLHQLGYWPQESFVVVALAGHSIGPCVRIDLPGPEDNTAAYLHRIFSLLPATIDGAQPIDRFIAFYCTADRDNLRARQTASGTRTLPSTSERERDAAIAYRVERWLPLLTNPTVTGGLECFDCIVLGDTTIWELSHEQNGLIFAGFVEDILMSPYHLAQTVRGESIAATASEVRTTNPWDTAATADTGAREDWEAAAELWYRTYTQEYQLRHAEGEDPHLLQAHSYCQQKGAELCYWETALEAIRWVMRTLAADQRTTVGDRMRQLLPAEVAGYLAASLNTYGTINLVTYCAAATLTDSLRVLEGYGGRFTDPAPTTTGEGTAIEPGSYGAPPRRRNTLPSSFLQTLHGKQHRVGSPSGVRTGWHDWVRRTHLTVQRSATDVSQTQTDYAEAMARLLCGTDQTVSPRWERLNALEVLCSLLIPAACGEPLGRLRIVQAWINWMRGTSSYANLLNEEAHRHVQEHTPLDDALHLGLLPLWLGDSARCWRGPARFSVLNVYPVAT